MGFPVLSFLFGTLLRQKKSKQNQLLFLISAIVLYLFYSLVLRTANLNFFFFLINKNNVRRSILYGKLQEAKNKTDERVKVDIISRACKWN